MSLLRRQMVPLPSLSLNQPSPLCHPWFSFLLLVSFSFCFTPCCCLTLVMSSFFPHLPLVFLLSPSSPVYPAPLTLTLFLSSRKSLSTICLAVMNSAPFRTNHLGQINETLQGDKLYVSVRACVTESVYVPKMRHNPSTTQLNLSSDKQPATRKCDRQGCCTY